MFEDCNSMKSVPLFNTSNVNNMAFMFDNCKSLIDINPYNFQRYDFSRFDNTHLKETYPELYI